MNNYFIAQLDDLVNLSIKRRYQTESHFLTLEEQELAINYIKKLPSLQWELFGGYPEAMRKKLLLDAYEVNKEITDICLLHIKPRSKEHTKELTHRDYLGAILNLGIKRNVLGDLLVSENEALVIIEEKLSCFIMDELIKVKHTFVEITKSNSINIPEAFLPKLIEITGNIASERLDLIVGWLTGSSRSKAEILINNGLVKIGDQIIYDKSKKVPLNSLITIKTKGKFIFQEIIGKSKKDRLIVKGFKYN